MHRDQQGWGGDKDELQSPQPDVRHREKVVIAHIFATWLQSVADKIFLFIAPHFLSSHYKDHDTKNEDDGDPYLPDAGGVTPVHRVGFLVGKALSKIILTYLNQK
uniref:Uncharacterized protein n=1 Tax=Canis lupus familiaris TaxID=9615 RepID=A0A8C0TP13_CANLF